MVIKNNNTLNHNISSGFSHGFKPKIHGFTLVELIITITILVILGTIAFTNLSGFSGSARDSSRVSDLTNLTKGLEMIYLKTGSYPTPDNAFAVTYSGGALWFQGTIGNSSMNIINAGGGFKFSKKPTDPLVSSKEYIYSKLSYGNTYQIKADWEGESLTYKEIGILDQVHADTGNPTLAYIKGNYNGMVAKTQTGNVIYLLAVPGVISNTGTMGTSLDIMSNALSGTLLSHGKSNTTGVSFIPKVVYSSGALPSTQSEQILFARGIANAYSGTMLASTQAIQPFIIAANINNTEALAILGKGVHGIKGGGGSGDTLLMTNIINTSCKTILDSGGSVGNGTYLIDIDGTGASAPFNVYCDMNLNGGAILAMNLDTSDGQIRYARDINYWLSNTYGVGTNFGIGDYKNLNVYNNFYPSKIIIVIHDNGTKIEWRSWNIINTGSTLYSKFGSNNNRIGVASGNSDISSLTGVENVVSPPGDLYFNLIPSDDTYRIYNDGKQASKIIDGGTTTSNLYGVLGGGYGPYGSPIIQAEGEATSYYTGFGPWSKSFGTDYTANTTGTSQGSCGLNYDYAIYLQ